MAKASGRHEQSGRDGVFRMWFEDNIVAAGNGAAIEESAIYKAYRAGVHEGTALGRQGVHRMLNELGVRRSVRVGKPMRLGVGFKPLVSASDPAGQPPPSASRPPPAPAAVEDGAADEVERDRANLIRMMAWEGSEEYPTMCAVRDVFAERRRQVAEEGFDIAHDDASDPGAHERAAATYAFAAGQPDHHAAYIDVNAKRPRAVGSLGWMARDIIVMLWPWAMGWWKPKTDEPDWKRRCMVKACALLIAAIERFDREKARASLEAAQAKDMTGV